MVYHRDTVVKLKDGRVFYAGHFICNICLTDFLILRSTELRKTQYEEEDIEFNFAD